MYDQVRNPEYRFSRVEAHLQHYKLIGPKETNSQLFISICPSERYIFINMEFTIKYGGERSGSVVECLTPDGGVAGSNLTSITALCP